MELFQETKEVEPEVKFIIPYKAKKREIC